MNKEERILCAAIHYDDGRSHVHQPRNITSGIVVCGHRHHNVFPILASLYPERSYLGKSVQGFLTSENRFVDREEAMQIAIAAGQVEGEGFEGTQLYSEDLY